MPSTIADPQPSFGMPTQPLAGSAYYVKTFGCQMNKHDSERVAGMLETMGCYAVAEPEQADVVVYMTCCVREGADTREYGQISSLDADTAPHGKRIIAVGGCIGQRDGELLAKRIKTVDIVFGTHNIDQLPQLIQRVLEGEKKVISTPETDSCFSSDLPSVREQAWHAWVPIMTGCNNFCSYCIVPYVRGRERSRSLEEIQSELMLLAANGVKEVTLLGQNVNSYGRDNYGSPRFAEVLRMADGCGIPRVRFATSHPKDMSDETIAALGECKHVMPALHLPVQSGSVKILQDMNRHYTPEHYLNLVEKIRAAKPSIALSTDVIVGFPGETEADFEDTFELVKQVGYAQAFTFIYSKREGTPAAKIADPTPREAIQQRFDRLVDLVQESAYTCNQMYLGSDVEVLVEGASKRDGAILSGRGPQNQVVHFPVPEGRDAHDFEGAFAKIHVDQARTWYLSGALLG